MEEGEGGKEEEKREGREKGVRMKERWGNRALTMVMNIWHTCTQ